MGLDMYARRVAGGAALECLADPLNPDFTQVDVARNAMEGDFWYWRKHADLHGWMERLYRERGGEEEQFNCIPLRLTLEDLTRLEADMDKGLETTTGFFFGQSTAEDAADTRAFITTAKEAIEAGDAIYYDSWW